MDGKEVDKASDSSEVPAAAASLEIGRCEGVAYFIGLMDEFLIVKRALSETENLNYFKGGVAGVLAVQSLGKPPTSWGNIKTEALR